MLALALRAASIQDDQADAACDLLVMRLNERLNENQKEVAAELSRLAIEVESSLGPDHSFHFKQKTCAAMLKLNMEQRRKARSGGNS